MLRLSEIIWDPSWASKPWYKDDKFDEFYRVQGHDTNRCIYVRKIVQSFIDNSKLVFNGTSSNPNKNLQVY